MIAILDYGIGNVNSIVNMFKKIGVYSKLVKDKYEVEEADKIVLPGVGAFDYGMKKLNEAKLTEVIKRETLINKKPILGICLGMQMLGRRSEEGKSEGLGLIGFDNIKFRFEDKKLIVPHMGWNYTKNMIIDDPLLVDLPLDQRYYFVHSFHALCDKKENILMECDYGYNFTAAVKQDNIYGVQFHPEKSHKFGMKLLKNFAENL